MGSRQQDEQPLDDARKVLKNYQKTYQKITKERLQHQQLMQQHQDKKTTMEQNIEQLITDSDQQFKDLKQALFNHQIIYEKKMRELDNKIERNKAQQLKYYQKINFYKDLRSHLEEEILFKNSREDLENTVYCALLDSVDYIQTLTQASLVWVEYCTVLAEIGIVFAEYPTKDFIGLQVKKLMQNIMGLNLDSADAFAQRVFACIPGLSTNEANFIDKIAALINQRNLVFDSRNRLSTIRSRINQRYFENMINPVKEIDSATQLILHHELKISQAGEALNVLEASSRSEENLYRQFKSKVNSFYDLVEPSSDNLLIYFDQLLPFIKDAKSDLTLCITTMKNTLSDLVKNKEYREDIDTTSAKYSAHQQDLIEQETRILNLCNNLEESQINIEIKCQNKIVAKHSRVMAEAARVLKYQEAIDMLECHKLRYQKLYENFSGKIIDIKSQNDELLNYENSIEHFADDLQNIKQLLSSGNYLTLWDDEPNNESYFPQTRLIEITVNNPVIRQHSLSPVDEYPAAIPTSSEALSLEDELQML